MSPQPLAEPAVLMTTNCPDCRGCGQDERLGIACPQCEGSGREVNEQPVSVLWEMAQREHTRITAQPPSMVRDALLDESG